MKTATTNRAVSGACPTFFRAACREASRGGTFGYADVGYNLAGHVARILDDDGNHDRMDVLADAIYTTYEARPGVRLVGPPDHDAALAWFVRELPRCMRLVPPRRSYQFMQGVYRWAIEEGNDITVF